MCSTPPEAWSCGQSWALTPRSRPGSRGIALQFARVVVLLAWVAFAIRQLPAQTSASSFSDLQKRAEQARKSDQTEEAVSLYRKATTLRPAWTEGWWYLGTGLYDLRRYDQALDAFHHMAALQPKDGSAWALLGLSEFQLGRYAAALQHLNRAEELRMGDNQEMALMVRYHVVLLLNRDAQFERARDHLNAFASLGDVSPPILEAVGIGTLRIPKLPSEIPPEKHHLITKAGEATWEPYLSGHPEQANQIFEELLASNSSEPNLHYAYGVHLLDSDPEKAIQEFQRELQVTPTQVMARLQIVYLLLKQGNAKGALELAREAVKLEPDSFLPHNAAGRALLAVGQTASAIRELQIAVRLAPDSPENHFSLAEAYSSAGKTAEAAKERAEFERWKHGEQRPVGRRVRTSHCVACSSIGTMRSP